MHNSDTLCGRVRLKDSSGKISRLGVFIKENSSNLIDLEYISNGGQRVKAYLERTPENDLLLHKNMVAGDIVSLKGYWDEIQGEKVFIGYSGEILSRTNEDRKSPFWQMLDSVGENVHLRANVLNAIRSFFAANHFVETMTPSLLPHYEGGDAAPFTTETKGNGTRYLRETSELLLRRILGSGVPRVYEISKSFRNIGVNKNSLYEFTVIESAASNMNLEQGISLAQPLIQEVVRAANPSHELSTADWKQVNFNEMCDIRELQDYNGARKAWGKAIDSLSGASILVGPPGSLSPTTKISDGFLREAVFIYRGAVLCDIVEFETDFANISERMKIQEQRTKRPSNTHFLKFAQAGLPPGTGIGFGLERWISYLTARDITTVRNVGGII